MTAGAAVVALLLALGVAGADLDAVEDTVAARVEGAGAALGVLDAGGVLGIAALGDVVGEAGGAGILFKNQRTVALFDLVGKSKWRKSINLNEISEMAAVENSSGKMTVVLLDGIENELYLLNELGELIDDSSKHGEQKIALSGFGTRGFSITTFLGNYLIQYNK